MGSSTSASSKQRPVADDAAQDAAVKQLERWGQDPVAFVMDVFGPGYEELHHEPLVLDPWQIEALSALVNQPKRRFAFAACKNALKTTTLAWTAWWFLVTRYDAQIICTSISGDNLRDNLWKELGVWYGLSPMLQAQFEKNTQAIEERTRRDTWWCHARSWPKDADSVAQAKTLAGFHSKKVMYLGDEAGDYPPGVIAAAEAIFNDAYAECYLLLAGNTTQTGGPLWRAVRNAHNLYWVKRITGDPDDPGRCTRISVEKARADIAEYGRDHPYVKINILGEFPESAPQKLLGPDDFDRATRRNPQKADFIYEPIIIGIDTADGGDDKTSLCRRQGCVVFKLKTWRMKDLHLDVMSLADEIAAYLVVHQPDAVFIDLGGPSGHGIQSRLKTLGFATTGVDFGSDPIGDDHDGPQHGNRRAEMAWKAAKWVKTHGSLPVDDELRGDILEPNFWFPVHGKQTKLMIEPKDEIKKRLGRSPDRGDSFWLTFAAPVLPRGMRRAAQEIAAMRAAQGGTRHDPYAVLGGRSSRR